MQPDRTVARELRIRPADVDGPDGVGHRRTVLPHECLTKMRDADGERRKIFPNLRSGKGGLDEVFVCHRPVTHEHAWCVAARPTLENDSGFLDRRALNRFLA